jgi:hypothetical protein
MEQDGEIEKQPVPVFLCSAARKCTSAFGRDGQRGGSMCGDALF